MEKLYKFLDNENNSLLNEEQIHLLYESKVTSRKVVETEDSAIEENKLEEQTLKFNKGKQEERTVKDFNIGRLDQ